MAANVGKLDWISGYVCVNRDGWGRKRMLPAVDKALDSLDQAILGDGIEEANQIIVDCVEIH